MPKPNKIAFKKSRRSKSTSKTRAKSKPHWERRLAKKEKKLNFKNKKFNSAANKHKIVSREKNYRRAFITTTISQIIAPIMTKISLESNNNEKIQLAKIKADLEKAKTEKDVEIAKTKLQLLYNKISQRKDSKGDKMKDKDSKDQPLSPQTGFISTNPSKWSNINGS